MPKTEILRDFVEAVVGGATCKKRKTMTVRLEKEFRDWFAPKPNVTGENEQFALKAILLAHTIPLLMWWRSESLTDEAPTTWFEIYVAKLRDRLRAIWEAQNKHGKRQAKYLIFRAICEQQENRKSLQEVNQVQPEGDDWCARTIDALEWLTKSCGKMMICSNTNCQATKYFIKRYPNNKYCCEKCVATGLKASRARTVKLEKKN